MRGAFLLTSLVLASMALAGCFGGGDETTTTTTTSTTTSRTTTTQPPNLPPVLALKITDANGTETDTTLVGGSLVFDATGSKDQDSDGLNAVAISVKDGNRTYPTQVLYANGVFTPATFTFDRPGPVAVTVRAIDVRGDLASKDTSVYVNSVQAIGGHEFRAPGGLLPAGADPTTCGSPVNPLLDPVTYKEFNIDVQANASFIEVTSTNGGALFAICAPRPDAETDGEPLSEAVEDVAVSNNQGPLPAPASTFPYYLAVYSTDPQVSIPLFSAVVHYEPRAAAAA